MERQPGSESGRQQITSYGGKYLCKLWGYIIKSKCVSIQRQRAGGQCWITVFRRSAPKMKNFRRQKLECYRLCCIFQVHTALRQMVGHVLTNLI